MQLALKLEALILNGHRLPEVQQEARQVEAHGWPEEKVDHLALTETERFRAGAHVSAVVLISGALVPSPPSQSDQNNPQLYLPVFEASL